MILYIYKPHNWDYCGGVVIIAAKCIENTNRIWKEYNDEKVLQEYIRIVQKGYVPKFYGRANPTLHEYARDVSEGYRETEQLITNPQFWGEGWLLCKQFSVPAETEERVVMVEYNYA